jgi:hypothetical protein
VPANRNRAEARAANLWTEPSPSTGAKPTIDVLTRGKVSRTPTGGTDYYELGAAMARAAMTLCTIVLLVGGATLAWWLIRRARRLAPPRPSGYRDPPYPEPPTPATDPDEPLANT